MKLVKNILQILLIVIVTGVLVQNKPQKDEFVDWYVAEYCWMLGEDSQEKVGQVVYDSAEETDALVCALFKLEGEEEQYLGIGNYFFCLNDGVEYVKDLFENIGRDATG